MRREWFVPHLPSSSIQANQSMIKPVFSAGYNKKTPAVRQGFNFNPVYKGALKNQDVRSRSRNSKINKRTILDRCEHFSFCCDGEIGRKYHFSR